MIVDGAVFCSSVFNAVNPLSPKHFLWNLLFLDLAHQLILGRFLVHGSRSPQNENILYCKLYLYFSNFTGMVLYSMTVTWLYSSADTLNNFSWTGSFQRQQFQDATGILPVPAIDVVTGLWPINCQRWIPTVKKNNNWSHQLCGTIFFSFQNFKFTSIK